MKTTEHIKKLKIHGLREELGTCNYEVEVKWSDGEKGYLMLPSFRVPKKYRDSINKVEKYLYCKGDKYE